MWRTANCALLVPPLDLAESVRAVAFHGNVIITAASHQIGRAVAGRSRIGQDAVTDRGGRAQKHYR